MRFPNTNSVHEFVIHDPDFQFVTPTSRQLAPCAVQMSERVVTPRNSLHLCRTAISCDDKGNWIAASMRCVSWWRFVGIANDGPRSVNWVSDSASHVALVQPEGASAP